MTTSATIERTLAGEGATIALGRALARSLAPAASGVLALTGHLGAGKTTLVKGLAEGLGVAAARDVTSPTFLRVVRYEGTPPLVHVDAYRMSGPADVAELGLDEDFAGGAVVAIEWAEVIGEALPGDRIDVALDHASETTRRVRLTAGGPESSAWLARCEAAWAPS